MPTDVIEDRLVKIVKSHLKDSPHFEIEIPADVIETLSVRKKNDKNFRPYKFMQYILARALGYEGEKEDAAQFLSENNYDVFIYDIMNNTLKIKRK